jgi:hypothetical protein
MQKYISNQEYKKQFKKDTIACHVIHPHAQYLFYLPCVPLGDFFLRHLFRNIGCAEKSGTRLDWSVCFFTFVPKINY